MTTIKQHLERFKEMSDSDIIPSETEYERNSTEEWLNNHTNEHLFNDSTYPESRYELDQEKVSSSLPLHNNWQRY